MAAAEPMAVNSEQIRGAWAALTGASNAFDMRACGFSAQHQLTDSLIRDSSRQQRAAVDLARAAASVRGVRGAAKTPDL